MDSILVYPRNTGERGSLSGTDARSRNRREPEQRQKVTLLIRERVQRSVVLIVVKTRHRSQRIDERDDLILYVPVEHVWATIPAATRRTTRSVTCITPHSGLSRNA